MILYTLLEDLETSLHLQAHQRLNILNVYLLYYFTDQIIFKNLFQKDPIMSHKNTETYIFHEIANKIYEISYNCIDDPNKHVRWSFLQRVNSFDM